MKTDCFVVPPVYPRDTDIETQFAPGLLWFYHTGSTESPQSRSIGPFRESLAREDSCLSVVNYSRLGLGAQGTDSGKSTAGLEETQVPLRLIAVPPVLEQGLSHFSLIQAPLQLCTMSLVWVKQNSLPLRLIYLRDYFHFWKWWGLWAVHFCLSSWLCSWAIIIFA